MISFFLIKASSNKTLNTFLEAFEGRAQSQAQIEHLNDSVVLILGEELLVDIHQSCLTIFEGAELISSDGLDELVDYIEFLKEESKEHIMIYSGVEIPVNFYRNNIKHLF